MFLKEEIKSMSTLNKTGQTAESSQFYSKCIKFWTDRRKSAIAWLEKIDSEIALYQDKCGHSKIKSASREDLVIKFDGCCPDCGKIIIPPAIVKTSIGQYSKKE
jgi:hypothetical protein